MTTSGPGGTPGTVFGLSAYNGERHLAEAIESLLSQTRADLAVLVVDDGSTDGTGDVARRYADLDPRLVYVRNDRRLGLVRNWRRAFDLAGERFPAARFFAWASDHDVWHPRWLELLAAELELHAETVLAYPLTVRIDDRGSEYPTSTHRFATAGLASPAERLRRTSRELAAAGSAIYGLGRREAMARCGPFPLVVLPDRLYLARLALEGEFRQVERRLWFRRYRAHVAMSNARQRRASFPDATPWWANLPWPLTQAVLFARGGGGRLSLVFLGGAVGRAWSARRHRLERSWRWRRREWRRRARALARAGAVRAGRRPPPSKPSQPERASIGLAWLGRAEVLEDVATVVQLGERSPELSELVPGAVVVGEEQAEEHAGRIDLAVAVHTLGSAAEEDVRRTVERLYELGTPTLAVADTDTESLRRALGAWYWLRDVWVDEARPPGRRPDPATGPVPRPPGGPCHLVGRRRLLPQTGSVSGQG
ncbi:MAG TPA: glycosyltransferase [Gaiellaceae bacterium]|nr:glycosyltransferase [Gaiellaceae bacterium]